MKTSILVSSFAALCLLITYGESPHRTNAANKVTSLVIKTTHVQANNAIKEAIIKLSASNAEKAEVKAFVTLAEDYSYLKFKAADYMNDNESLTIADAENSFENIKFDVNNYIESDKTTSFEEMQLPSDEFENLKFDVTKYTDRDEMKSDNIQELPFDEFSFVKFDVNNKAAPCNIE